MKKKKKIKYYYYITEFVSISQTTPSVLHLEKSLTKQTDIISDGQVLYYYPISEAAYIALKRQGFTE